METEIWEEVKGYEGLYEVSNFGRVRSLDRVIPQMYHGKIFDRKMKGKMLNPVTTHDGYLTVHLSNKGHKIVKVHRLVAIAFIPNTELKETVNHKDGNKKNNHVSNLEWCSRDENFSHAYNTGLLKWPKGEHHHLSIKIEQFSLKNEFIKQWHSMQQVESELGYLKSSISRCILGKAKTAYGFIWKKCSFLFFVAPYIALW